MVDMNGRIVPMYLPKMAMLVDKDIQQKVISQAPISLEGNILGCSASQDASHDQICNADSAQPGVEAYCQTRNIAKILNWRYFDISILPD